MKGDSILQHDIILKVSDISMAYHTVDKETLAIENVSFDVRRGEFFSIVGPSGCGKSTLLSIISGLLKPESGSIIIDDQPVSGSNPKIGYMLQRDHLFEWRNILQNVLLGLEVQHKLSKETKEHAIELLDTYGLYDFKYNYPNQLSGGMRQKVALIRTLAIDPEVLLLDEPFSSLDYQTRLYISDEVNNIIQKEKKTAILVTHDISEAVSMSDRVMVLSHRPATVKNIYDIVLSGNTDSAIGKRTAPEFREYFNMIWKELDIHES